MSKALQGMLGLVIVLLVIGIQPVMGGIQGVQSLLIFGDAYGPGISLVDFGGATNVVTIDNTEFRSGTASLKIAVPASGYTGGTLVIATPQNLTTNNALTFWAKVSVANNLDVAGFGDDGAGNRKYFAEWGGIPLTTTWTKYIIPIPLASKLTAQSALFHFAKGAQNGAFSIWLDDIQYETVGGGVIGAGSPAIATETVSKSVGDPPFGINGASVVFPVSGNNQVISCARGYFTWTSSNPGVASVDTLGLVTPLAAGSADITASLGGVAAAGVTTVNVSGAAAPTTIPRAPTQTQGDVISLYSHIYTDVPVDTWRTPWTPGGVVLTDPYAIPGITPAYNVKKYSFTSSDNFVGIEFIGTPPGSRMINATTMVYFNIDVWTPSVSNFQIKLVDFGADRNFGGGDDTEAIFTATAGSNPPLTNGTWAKLQIPLSSFTPAGPSWNRSNLAQMLFVVPLGGVVYVDNIYFSRTPTTSVNAPTDIVPSSYVLEQNYPNPFNPSTTIRYSLPVPGEVSLKVYNVLGEQVADLVDGFRNAGTYDATLDAANLSSGTYVYVLRAGSFTSTKKMLLLR